MYTYVYVYSYAYTHIYEEYSTFLVKQMLRQSLEYTVKLKRGIKNFYIAIHTLTSCIICMQNGCGKRDLIRRWHCRSGLLEQKLWVGIQKAWFQAFVLLLFSRCVMMTMVIHLYDIFTSSLKV